MSESIFIVQFPHPGGEHQPLGASMPWNQHPFHKRKYMLAGATYRDNGGHEHRGKVAFWGEWEGPSRVLQRWPKEGDLPTVLHQPYLSAPPTGRRQNTDPWVFGETFLYSNCKQRTNKGWSPTAMQGLTPGSLILFGSTLAGQFVLDTAFVVGSRLGSFVVDGPLSIEVDETFRVATIESLTSGAGNSHGSFMLYAGATASQPVHSIFSFVPCLPQGEEGPRFSRPVIRLPDIINPQSKQATSGATRPRDVSEVVRAWQSVVAQVTDQGLLLATQIEPIQFEEDEPASRRHGA